MISSRQGQMPKVSALGQGMCQKVMIVASRQALAHHPRQQREVVVLDQHDRIVRVVPPATTASAKRWLIAW